MQGEHALQKDIARTAGAGDVGPHRRAGLRIEIDPGIAEAAIAMVVAGREEAHTPDADLGRQKQSARRRVDAACLRLRAGKFDGLRGGDARRGLLFGR